MKSEVLQKYVGVAKTETNRDGPDNSEGLVNFQAFGLLRGIRERAVMLELRHKDGRIDAFAYAWLGKVSFDPSDGITLRFGGETVTIKGRNLNAEVQPNVRLFAALVRHRVPYIQEADGPQAMMATRGALIVDQITVK